MFLCVYFARHVRETVPYLHPRTEDFFGFGTVGSGKTISVAICVQQHTFSQVRWHAPILKIHQIVLSLCFALMCFFTNQLIDSPSDRFMGQYSSWLCKEEACGCPLCRFTWTISLLNPNMSTTTRFFHHKSGTSTHISTNRPQKI